MRRSMYNQENYLITLLPTYNSSFTPPNQFVCVILPVIFFLPDQTRYFVLSLGYGFVFGSVRFLVYTPTIQFVFPLFVFPFASWVVSFFFDVRVMGVTSRCLASRDNLIKNKKEKLIWVLHERIFSVQWLLASLCGLHCVHGLRGVSSLCHIARCQRLLVIMYGFRLGGSNGFFFHPSFSLIFLRHFHHPFHLVIWFQLFACLIRAAIFHLTLAIVLICLSL